MRVQVTVRYKSSTSKLTWNTVAMTVLISALFACQQDQNKAADNLASPVIVAPISTPASPAHKTSPVMKQHCQKLSPPVKDLDKLATMLRKSGQITDAMTTSEQQQIIQQYLKRKQQVAKNCQISKPQLPAEKG